jgi:hypothetical protein
MIGNKACACAIDEVKIVDITGQTPAMMSNVSNEKIGRVLAHKPGYHHVVDQVSEMIDGHHFLGPNVQRF